jgi:glycosyltransferase involved in cell wall biosynthesis
MFLTIVIPTYNRSVFLHRALTSLQAQSDQDFEVLIIDDGSTDVTRATVLPFLSSRYHYIYQVNSERAVARNKGISHAIGRYIYFLDSDDFLLKNHVSLFKATAHQNSYPPIVAARSSFKSSSNLFSKRQVGKSIIYKSTELLFGNQFSCNFGVRSDALRSRFVEDRSVVTMEDWIFLLQNTFPDRTIAMMPLATVLMTDHIERSMHQHSAVISARVCATSYLLGHVNFSSRQSKMLVSNSHLFNAIHQRLAGFHVSSLLSLSKVDLCTLNMIQFRSFFTTFIRAFLGLVAFYCFRIRHSG